MTPATNFTRTPRTDVTRIEDLTRREFIFSAFGAALLIACGDDDDDDSSSSGGTRLVIDGLGNQVEIPAKPQRIVSVGSKHAVAHLLSLGAPLVGAATDDGWPGTATDYFDLSTVEEVGQPGDALDIEAIVQLSPDLLVAGVTAAGYEDFAETTLARLREIAPLIALKIYGQPIEAYSAATTSLLALEETVLRDQQAEYAGVLDEIAALRPEGWGSIKAAAAQLQPEQNRVWVLSREHNSLPDTIARIGVDWVAIESDARAAGGAVQVSFERIQEIDCDLLLVFGDAPPDDTPLYADLGVVKANQVVDSFPGSTGRHYRAYIDGARFLLDQLRAMQPLRADIV